MGHLRLGSLPRTRKWKDVIALVDEGGTAAQVAEATLDAAEEQFTGADPAVVHAVWLLAQLPDAARSEDFPGALRALGLDVGDAPTPAEVVTALSRAIEDHLDEQGHVRTDVGEMARLAAAEALSRAVDLPTQDLFGPRPDAVQAALRAVRPDRRFSTLAREFFARLTERVLTYYVSRELPLHVGAGERFDTLDQQREFERAVALHARQAARIVEEFAGGWYSKARWQRDLTPERTRRFVAYAMKKMRGELRRGAT